MVDKEPIFFLSDFAKRTRFQNDFKTNIKNIDQWEELSYNFRSYKQKKGLNLKNNDAIPKIIHQIWLGPKKLPQKYSIWGKTWCKLNPTWEYKLWTDYELKKFPLFNQKLFDKVSNYGFKSDIARYEILNKYGGIYIDTDFECLKPIPADLLKYNFVSCIVFAPYPQIANGMMMSKINSNILKKIINNIKYINDLKNPKDTLISSGADNLTTQYFSSSTKEKEKCLILPSNYFYPYPNFDLNKSNNVYDFKTSYSIGLHHWECSWIIRPKWKQALRKIYSLLKT